MSPTGKSFSVLVRVVCRATEVPKMVRRCTRWEAKEKSPSSSMFRVAILAQSSSTLGRSVKLLACGHIEVPSNCWHAATLQ